MDFAQLGMKVDTRDIDRATQALDRLDKAAADVDGVTTKVTKSFDSFGSAVRNAQRMVVSLLAGLSVGAIAQYSDAWTSVSNQIRMVTTSTEQFNAVQAGVVAVAKASNAELGATASLYSTLARYASDLVESDTELLRITETLNKSFAVSGASAGAQAGAITQLSQALASGALRGDEFNSVNENAPRIMDAVAESLNMTKGELRDFAAEGGITSKVVIDAVRGMADQIDADFDGMTRTFAMFAENARTNVTRFIGESQTIASAMQGAGSAIEAMSENLHLLSNVLLAVSAVMAGRFISSVMAATPALLAKAAAMTQATVVTNVYSQRIVQATAAQNIMAGSSRALGAAMTFLGGPGGLILLAASALYLWNRNGEESYTITTDLSRSVESLGDSFRHMASAQRELAMMNLGTDIADLNVQIEQQQQRVAALAQEFEAYAQQFPGATAYIAAHQDQLVNERAELARLGGDLQRAIEIREEYLGILSENTKGTDANAAATAKLTDKQKELVASLRNELAALDMTEREAFIFTTTLKLGEEASAALTAEVKALAEALFDKKEALKQAEEAQKKASEAAKQYREDVARLLDELNPVDAALRDIAESQNLLFDAMVDGLIGVEQYMQGMAALDAQLAEVRNTTAEVSKEAKELEKAYERSIERIRDVIGDFFQNILLTGKLTFDGILDSFKRLIAEMIATAAANKVLISVGMAGASSTAAASSGLKGLGGGDILGKALTGAEGLFAKMGFGAGADFMYGVQEAIAKAGASVGMGSGVGAIMTAGAGILGAKAGQALGKSLFGKQAESNWGAAIGGILGAPGGPIGSAIGAALGGALDAFMGGDGKQRVTLGVETNPYAMAGARGYSNQFVGASGIAYTGRATRADTAAADEMASLFANLDNALTKYVNSATGGVLNLTGRSLSGRSSQAGLAVQDGGVNSFFGSAEFNSINAESVKGAAREFVLAWFDEVEEAMGGSLKLASMFRDFKGTIDEFLVFADVLMQFQSNAGFEKGARTMEAALSLLERFEGSGEEMLAFAQALGSLLAQMEGRPLKAAMFDFEQAQMTLTDRYQQQSVIVRELSAAYDGSQFATEALTTELAAQQKMAYDLATAFLQVREQVSALFGGLSESIRTSLMSEEELYNYQRDQVNALTQMLSTLTDPNAIFATAQDIERRVASMWSALDETQQQAMGADFLAYVEETARLAQERLQAGIDSLQTSQGDLNDVVREALIGAGDRLTNAATLIESAAIRLEGAAQSMEYAASRAARTTEAN